MQKSKQATQGVAHALDGAVEEYVQRLSAQVPEWALQDALMRSFCNWPTDTLLDENLQGIYF